MTSGGDFCGDNRRNIELSTKRGLATKFRVKKGGKISILQQKKRWNKFVDKKGSVIAAATACTATTGKDPKNKKKHQKKQNGK